MGFEMALSRLAPGCTAGGVSGRHRRLAAPQSAGGAGIGLQPVGSGAGTLL